MKPKIKTVLLNKKFKRLGTQTLPSKELPSKEWISRYAELQTIEQRGNAVKWSLRVFAVTLLCTFGIYLLEGFKVMGFSLPEPLLKSLEWSTVGQTAGLVTVVFKFLFK
jgi:hypothetical protein